jgi:tetratricopeptide (TPR) repeat protein
VRKFIAKFGIAMRVLRAASEALVTIMVLSAVGAVALADDHNTPPARRKPAVSGHSGGHHHDAAKSQTAPPGILGHGNLQTSQATGALGSAIGIHARTSGPRFQPYDGTSGGRRSAANSHVRQLAQQSTVTPALSTSGIAQSWAYAGASQQSQFSGHHAAGKHHGQENMWEVLNAALKRGGAGSSSESRNQQSSKTPVAVIPYFGWGYSRLSLGHDALGYSLGSHVVGANQSGYAMRDSSDRGAYTFSSAGGAEELPPARAAAGTLELWANKLGRFVLRGQYDFRRENFASAAANLRQAMRDDPGNGTLALLLAQALFATGRFSEAGATLRQGLLMLPEEQWGVVVRNRNEIYPKVGVYAKHLRALENAVTENANSPELKLLLGYHYGYLGFTQHAVGQLERAGRLAPEDELTKRLFNHFRLEAEKEKEKASEKPARSPKGVKMTLAAS